jgi:CubicO group peptidase (beta-lactamase class C family)
MRVAVLVSFCMLSHVLGATQGEIADKANRVDDLFKEIKGPMPGVAVLVVRDGNELYKKAFGLADIKGKTEINATTRP